MTEPETIWIIGLSGAGKSTLARLFVQYLRDHGTPCILYDGDEVREIFDNRLGYDAASRRKQTVRIKRLVRLAVKQDILPVVAIIHPFEDDRQQCRREFPGYLEVYLRCDMKELIRRDTKKLYLPAIRGQKRNVIGVDIPFDEPRGPDLVIDSDQCDPDRMLTALRQMYEAGLESGRQS